MKIEQNLPLWLIALGTGSAVMGITLITPALPVMAAELNELPETVQLLLTFYLVMLASGQLLYGPLSDAFGRRFFFRMGALMVALAGLAAVFIKDINLLIICRSLQGLGAAACISMGRTMLNDRFTKQDAARAMASVQTIQAIVPMVALTTGGAIVFYAGWSGVMLLITLSGVMLTIGSFFFLPETHVNRTGTLNIQMVSASYKAVLKNGLFWNFMLISSFQVGAFFTLNAFIPYAYKAIGVSTLAFGFWFGMTPFGYILGNLFNRLYMVKKGVERAALAGCISATTALLLLLATSYFAVETPLALALPCILFGFSNGLTVANATIGGIGAASANAGTASGLIGAFTMMVGAVGGAVVIALGADLNVMIGFIGMFVMVCVSLTSAIIINLRVKAAPVI